MLKMRLKPRSLVLGLLIAALSMAGCDSAAPPQNVVAGERPTPTPLPENITWTQPAEPITPGNAQRLQRLGRLEFPGQPSTPFAYALSPDQTQLIAFNNSFMASWDLVTGEQIFANSRNQWNSLYYSPDKDEFYTLNPDGVLGFFSTEDGAQQDQLRGHPAYSGVSAFNPREGWLALGGQDGSVRVWDTFERQALVTLGEGDGAAVTALAISDDGDTLAAAGADGAVRLWDWREGELLHNLSGVSAPESGLIIGLTFSHDGASLAVNAPVVSVWDVPTGTLRHTLDSSVSRDVFRFLPESSFLLVDGSDPDLTFFDVRTGEVAAVLTGFERDPRSVAMSPEGDLLLATSFGGEASLWNLLNLPTGAVARGAFTPAGGEQALRSTWTDDGLLILLFDARGPVDLWGIAESE